MQPLSNDSLNAHFEAIEQEMTDAGCVHNPTFREGAYVVGTTAPLAEGYNHAPIAWKHDHSITYLNNRRA